MPFDRRLGLSSARAFQKRAEALPHTVGQLPEGLLPTADEIGELVACAANLAFALELYLKTLLSGFDQDVPRHHDLDRLYDSLPTSAKRWSQAVFEEVFWSTWSGRRFKISLAVGASETPAWTDASVGLTLPTILKRSRSAFQIWRYAFEVSIPQGSRYQVRELEYGPLLAACDSLRLILEELVEGKSMYLHDPAEGHGRPQT